MTKGGEAYRTLRFTPTFLESLSSKDFTDVVWTALGQMKNVENVKGQGWRLKKG